MLAVRNSLLKDFLLLDTEEPKLHQEGFRVTALIRTTNCLETFPYKRQDTPGAYVSLLTQYRDQLRQTRQSPSSRAHVMTAPHIEYCEQERRRCGLASTRTVRMRVSAVITVLRNPLNELRTPVAPQRTPKHKQTDRNVRTYSPTA